MFILPNHVIKMPSFFGSIHSTDSKWTLFLLGLVENIRETKASKYNNLVNGKLCPIVFSGPGGILNVMKKARVMTDHDFQDFDYNAFITTSDYIISVECKPSSFGFIDGKIVAIDYSGVFEKGTVLELFKTPLFQVYSQLWSQIEHNKK